MEPRIVIEVNLKYINKTQLPSSKFKFKEPSLKTTPRFNRSCTPRS